MSLPVPWNWPPIIGGSSNDDSESVPSAFPYIGPPATADDFNDEFDSGSADLVDRGMVIVASATSNVLTRVGEISPYASVNVGEYRSSIIGSWLYVQGAEGTGIDVYKEIPGGVADGDTFFARVTGCFALNSAAESRYNEVGVYADNAGALSDSNRVFCTMKNGTTASFLLLDAGRITAGAFSGVGERLALGGSSDIRAIRYASGTSYSITLMDAASGIPASILVSGAPAGSTLTRFGLRNAFSNSGSVIAQIWGIDFIRKKTANAWLIP